MVAGTSGIVQRKATAVLFTEFVLYDMLEKSIFDLFPSYRKVKKDA